MSNQLEGEAGIDYLMWVAGLWEMEWSDWLILLPITYFVIIYALAAMLLEFLSGGGWTGLYELHREIRWEKEQTLRKKRNRK